ncbi:MAG: folylpolyglutamate synthase/dihydrofolate synthase family protein [Clostridia bacterium]
MTYEQALQTIKNVENFAQKPSLNRIKKVLNALGNPQDNCKVIHLVGTNGKGSITSMTANILQHSGLKVGKYISPYIYEFGERISINGVNITPQKLSYYVEKVKNITDSIEFLSLSEFEFITVIAFLYFSDEQCDIVCLEAGLGGEFDATNVISSPILSVLTKVSYDHTQILGNTLTEIARTKCAVIKDSVCISYPVQDEEVLAVIKDLNVVCDYAHKLCIKTCEISGSEISFDGKDYKISLIGEHQIYNATTVIEVCNQLIKQGYGIGYEDVYYGLANTKFNARMEIISEKPLVIFDGAHNLDGILALENNIKAMFSDKKITLVMGMLKDKQCRESVEILSKYCQNTIFTRVNTPRTEKEGNLLQYSKCKGTNMAIPDVKKALDMAKKLNGDVIVVCGSLYLAEQIKN